MKESNFKTGDYVLTSTREFLKGEKLTLSWKGPKRVWKIVSENIYGIENMLYKSNITVHASRLRLYHQKSKRDTTKYLLVHVLHNEPRFVVDKIVDLSHNQGENQYEENLV